MQSYQNGIKHSESYNFKIFTDNIHINRVQIKQETYI